MQWRWLLGVLYTITYQTLVMGGTLHDSVYLTLSKKLFPFIQEQFHVKLAMMGSEWLLNDVKNTCIEFNICMEVVFVDLMSITMDCSSSCAYFNGKHAVPGTQIVPEDTYYITEEIQLDKGFQERTYYIMEMADYIHPELIRTGFYGMRAKLVVVQNSAEVLSPVVKFQADVNTDIMETVPLQDVSCASDHEGRMKQTCGIQPTKSLNGLYSSHRCIGGSQSIGHSFEYVSKIHKDFPQATDAEYRVCHFKNVCLGKNHTMQYFLDPDLYSLPIEFLPSGFDTIDTMFHVGFCDEEKISVEVIPGRLPLQPRQGITFLDATSNSFNFGHVLVENTLSHFTASRIFEVPFKNSSLIFHSACDHTCDYPKTDEQVHFKDVPLTFRQMCMNTIDYMTQFFFDNRPAFLDSMEPACFSDVIVGQGSAFSFKSLDLSRATILRDFRDFFLDRYKQELSSTRSNERINILVALQGSGLQVRSPDTMLCNRVNYCVETSALFPRSPVVRCVTPEEMTFLEEIKAARESHVIVSYDGSVSYISFFARSNTQHLMISRERVKDNQLQMWATHFNTLYLKKETYPQKLCQALLLSVKNVVSFDSNQDDSNRNMFDIVITVGPLDGSLLDLQLKYTQQNVIGYRNIYIVTRNQEIINQAPHGCIVIDESIFPFSIRSVGEIHGISERNGWYLQQLLKFYAGFVIPEILERYLVIDSDTMFLKPTSFISEDGRFLFAAAVEHHLPYFSHMERLHPTLTRMAEHSGIAHHMIFDKRYVKELMLLVEEAHGGKQFWKVFLEQVKEVALSGASEYEIYFNYMLRYHQGQVEVRQLAFLNTGLVVLLNLDAFATSNQFNFVSFQRSVDYAVAITIEALGRRNSEMTLDVELASGFSHLSQILRNCTMYELGVSLEVQGGAIEMTSFPLCSFVIGKEVEVKQNSLFRFGEIGRIAFTCKMEIPYDRITEISPLSITLLRSQDRAIFGVSTQIFPAAYTINIHSSNIL